MLLSAITLNYRISHWWQEGNTALTLAVIGGFRLVADYLISEKLADVNTSNSVSLNIMILAKRTANHIIYFIYDWFSCSTTRMDAHHWCMLQVLAIWTLWNGYWVRVQILIRRTRYLHQWAIVVAVVKVTHTSAVAITATTAVAYGILSKGFSHDLVNLNFSKLCLSSSCLNLHFAIQVFHSIWHYQSP